MIEAKNVSKTYHTKIKKGFFHSEKKTVHAVNNISFTIPKGKIVGLLGINGAGKTTTIKMLSTILTPTSGEIKVDGLDINKDARKIKRKVNMVAGGERMIYWRLTAKENLWYYGQLYGLENKVCNDRIKQLLELVGLTEHQDIPVERYSKGMKQRLQIARGLINNPDYIFLDEPTLGLDVPVAKELRAYIRKLATDQNKGLLLTTHYMQEVEELCDYVYILDNGKLLTEGDPKTLALLAHNEKELHIELNTISPVLKEEFITYCKSNKIPEVDCNHEENKFIVSFSEDISHDIVTFLIGLGAKIQAFYVKEPRLEDAILHLARR